MNSNYKKAINLLFNLMQDCYRNSEMDRIELSQCEYIGEFDISSLIGEVELIDADLAGYATSAIKNNLIFDEIENNIEKLSIFRSPVIVNFLSSNVDKYERFLLYIQSIENLRLALQVFCVEPFNNIDRNYLMKRYLYLFLMKKDIPNLININKILNKYHYFIPPDIDLNHFSGYMPVSNEIGFQYEIRSVSQREAEKYDIPDFNFDSSIEIISHGKKSLDAAFIVLATIGQFSNSIIFNPISEVYLNATDILEKYPDIDSR
ncbi:hypothetical protein ODD08_004632 [Salmonella enterica]|nr:hypothetical protein [Salmonella enterica]EJW2026369.1 hypothetical protein [Salmonella enterica]EJW2102436.1 hypothetical protein [Salmonella enterica]EJX0634502.1 hypothetical protein [Salmonella enterica]EKS4618683.1 hypothetical protein [Salmonella enterica]